MTEPLRWGPVAAPVRQLIVLLHGLGADGHDLIDLAPDRAQAAPHAAFLSPHAPEPFDGGGFGRQWFPLWDRSAAMLEEGAERARVWLDQIIDAELQRLGVTDYALMGFSQGAMMALHTGLRRTAPPRVILAYSGRLLSPDRLDGITHKPPVLLVHGARDEVVPPEHSRRAETLLRQAGVPVTSLFCPDLAHGLDDAGLAAGAMALQRRFAEK